MPTFSPQEGLSGLDSEEALAPQRDDALAVPQTSKTARLATKVGLLLTAAGLAASSAGCDNGKNNSAYAQGATSTTESTEPTVPGTPTHTGTTTPTPNPSANPFDNIKLVCSSNGLIDNNNTKAAENYRRMFVQTVVSGIPQLFEPCATSDVSGEMGRFVKADCSNDGQYRNCVVKDSYVDNSYNVVNTVTRVKWLLTGHNTVESAQKVGYIFPLGLSARTGTDIITIDPDSPVVYGQRMILDRQQPVTTVTPPAPISTTKRLTPPTPTYNPSKDTEQDRRLDNLEAQVAQNTAKNNEQDGTLNNHGELLKILVDSNNKQAGTPHPTAADYDALGRSRATK